MIEYLSPGLLAPSPPLPTDQPDNPSEENCGVIRTESSGGWQNRDCSIALPYVCKKKPNATAERPSPGERRSRRGAGDGPVGRRHKGLSADGLTGMWLNAGNPHGPCSSRTQAGDISAHNWNIPSCVPL